MKQHNNNLIPDRVSKIFFIIPIPITYYIINTLHNNCYYVYSKVQKHEWANDL